VVPAPIPMRIDKLAESVASWATLISALISFIGLIQSQTLLVDFGVLSAVGCSLALVYAHTERTIVRSARVTVEGRSIDSLNLANLRRRVNHSLFIRHVHRDVRVSGNDLTVSSRYVGFCRADRETGFEFSIHSENNIPFAQLNCSAFDLTHDPEHRHKIRPILCDADGLSKKLLAPFAAPLNKNDPFDILIECTLPGCLKSGVDYYTSSVSFDQKVIKRQTVTLTFSDRLPEWVRVYECSPNGSTRLLKDLMPVVEDSSMAHYSDAAMNMPAQSARIYVFFRAESTRQLRVA
jgi:hypothetical protein